MGAVLAGGHGSRMGGPKALAPLAGRPLAAYPLAAMREAGLQPVLVARAGIALDGLGDVAVWREPDASDRHPAHGVLCALERAGGPVVVLACDLPFVPAALLAALAAADRSTRAAGQPLIARYEPADAAALAAAAADGAALRRLPLAELALEPFGDPAADRAQRQHAGGAARGGNRCPLLAGL